MSCVTGGVTNNSPDESANALLMLIVQVPHWGSAGTKVHTADVPKGGDPNGGRSQNGSVTIDHKTSVPNEKVERYRFAKVNDNRVEGVQEFAASDLLPAQEGALSSLPTKRIMYAMGSALVPAVRVNVRTDGERAE